jgi:eukaryotic-like serine/threonine-protein kinase
MPRMADNFLKAVLRSGLLDRGQLQAALRAVPRDRRDDPETLAEHLIKVGKLSRFQARKLLKGTVAGLVLGPFQVLAPLGRGGMGAVFLARDHRSGELLALKVLPPRRARTEERVLARFRREMELSQRVAHPHLARTYEAGVCQGVYYLAMEFIPGKSLYRLVMEDGLLSVPRAAFLFAEAAAALGHAHDQGLIHRDLKPSNILITPNSHAKVLDLGLALMQGETAEAREIVGGQGYIVGSMDYIAPEQTENAADVDRRADLYGLGCTLYFALAGRPPFPGGTAREKIHRHRHEAPEPLHQLVPTVPEAFAGLVHRMMAKKPEQRWPSAHALRDELLPWGAREPVLPLDQSGDTAYQCAIITLAKAEVSTDLITEVLVVPEEASGLDAEATSRSVPLFPASASAPAREYIWIGLGLVGFWLVIFLVLGLFLLIH